MGLVLVGLVILAVAMAGAAKASEQRPASPPAGGAPPALPPAQHPSVTLPREDEIKIYGDGAPLLTIFVEDNGIVHTGRDYPAAEEVFQDWIQRVRMSDNDRGVAMLAPLPEGGGWYVKEQHQAERVRKMLESVRQPAVSGEAKGKPLSEAIGEAYARGFRKARALPLASPWPDVEDAAWSELVRALKRQGTGEISPSYGIGMFALSMPRLAELGLAEDVEPCDWHGRKVYAGKFKGSLTLEKLRGDRELQYRILRKSLVEYRRAIEAADFDLSDVEIEGEQPTLSGLLAVAQTLSSVDELTAWIDGSARRYKKTAELFTKANGLF